MRTHRNWVGVWVVVCMVGVLGLAATTVRAAVGEAKAVTQLSPALVLRGEGDGSAFGRGAGGIGDLDGDGVVDVLGTTYGKVAVLLMNSDGSVKAQQKIGDQIGGGPDLTDGSFFGPGNAALGDLDNDGVEDIVVGDAGDDSRGETDAGAIYVMFMNTNGTVRESKKITEGENGGPSLDAGDFFGHCIANIGDLDDDGVVDLVVNALFDESSAGANYILFMQTNGVVKGSPVKITSGVNNGPPLDAGDRFGGGLCGIGDLNDDGIEDIAAGTYYDDTGGQDRGCVWILFMNTNGTVNSYTNIASGVNNGPPLDDNDAFGSSLCALGDLDGDGVEDIAVGAGGDDGDVSNEGCFYVLFLETDGEAKGYKKVGDNTNGGPNLAQDDGLCWGMSSATIGDINGDGIMDLTAGASNDDEAGRVDGANVGALWVFCLNTNGTAKSAFKISDPLSPSDLYGLSVCGIGDWDGDGTDDNVVGVAGDDDTTTDSGTIYVNFMRSDGTVREYKRIGDQFNGGPDLQNGYLFGGSVALLGDVNDDGVNDLGVGAYGVNGLSGAAYVLFMAADATVKSNAMISGRTGWDAGEYWCVSMAALGDLNRDGVEDMAVGGFGDDTDRGAIDVLFLNTDGSVASSVRIGNGTNGGPPLQPTIPEVDGGDSFGIGLSSSTLGDLDRDGVVDIAVGGQGVDRNGKTACGAVWVLFMNTNGTVKSYVELSDGTNGAPTMAAGSSFGRSVDGIDDLDGDGVQDMVVGAYGNYTGSVYVLFMNTDGTAKGSVRISDKTGGGPDLGPDIDNSISFGTAVAGVGRVDSDRAEDIAVGAMQYDSHGIASGETFLLFMEGYIRRGSMFVVR